jgi:hypothetical protein
LLDSVQVKCCGLSPLKAFARMRSRFFALSFYPVRVQSLGHKRSCDSGDANEAPALIGVFHKFSDDQRREYARCFYPMAHTKRSTRIVKSLPGQLRASVHRVVS